MYINFSFYTNPIIQRGLKICLFLFLLLPIACSNSEEGVYMAKVLEEAQQQNQNYIPFTSDSIIKKMVAYYDHYGTSDEQIKAHYILGCVYRDLGEFPTALQCYHDALEKADTTDNKCDYSTLYRVHSQMASLFHMQFLPRNELNEIKSAYNYALLAHDTIAALRCYEHQANAYSQLHMTDSVAYYCRHSSQLYKNIGDTLSANSALSPLIYMYLEKEDWDMAENYLDTIESKSNIYNSTNKIHYLYNYKGLLYLGRKDYDAAKKNFYVALENSKDINALDFTYKNLCLLYQKTGEKDSLAKYSLLYCENNDTTIAKMSTVTVERMQSLYNFNRSMQIARKAEIERNKTKNFNQLLSAALLILCLLGMSVVLYLKNTKNKTINKQIKEIEMLQSTIAQLENKKQSQTDQLKKMEESPIIQKLKKFITHPKKAGMAELNELKHTANDFLPNFVQSLNQFGYKLQFHETILCILIKTGFRPSEIAEILDMTPQNISNLRARLNKKMFQTDKGAKDFQERIINLGIESS